MKFGGMLAFLKAAFRKMIINPLSRFQVVEEDCWNNGFSKVDILRLAVFCRTSDCRQSVFLRPAASSAAASVCDSLRCCSFLSLWHSVSFYTCSSFIFPTKQTEFSHCLRGSQMSVSTTQPSDKNILNTECF